MQSTKLNKVLKDLGLSENEAKVYMAALGLGSSTPTAIARNANIKRTTAYSVIESLRQQGLINVELRGLKQLYAAEDPERLKTVLEAKKLSLEQALPELSSLFNLHGGESVIKYYEGLPAMRGVYEGLIRDIQPHEEYLVMGDTTAWHKLDPDFFQGFLERRARLPIKLRLILTDTPLGREHKQYQKNYNELIKIFPQKVSLKMNMVVTPQKVVLHQLVPPIRAMVIENRFFIDMQQQVFNLLWDMLAD